jgi:hypothetical protein
MEYECIYTLLGAIPGLGLLTYIMFDSLYSAYAIEKISGLSEKAAKAIKRGDLSASEAYNKKAIKALARPIGPFSYITMRQAKKRLYKDEMKLKDERDLNNLKAWLIFSNTESKDNSELYRFSKN